jgi:hypothetical protein
MTSLSGTTASISRATSPVPWGHDADAAATAPIVPPTADDTDNNDILFVTVSSSSPWLTDQGAPTTTVDAASGSAATSSDTASELASQETAPPDGPLDLDLQEKKGLGAYYYGKSKNAANACDAVLKTHTGTETDAPQATYKVLGEPFVTACSDGSKVGVPGAGLVKRVKDLLG